MLEDDIEFEIDDRNSEYIAAAFNSLGAIDLLDTGLMDEDERVIIKMIFK